MSLLSGGLGLAFRELPADDGDGCRVAFSADRRIELIAFGSASDRAAAHVRRWADAVGGADLAVAAVCLRVEDVAKAKSELRGSGVAIEAELKFADLKPLPVRGVHELLLSKRDTLGLPVCLVSYQESRNGFLSSSGFRTGRRRSPECH